MHPSTGLMIAGLLLAGLGEAAGQPPACGISTRDWCPAPPGDPYGRHANTAACQADPKCFGMRYRGESVVPCIFDERGFASNCPTVGCTSAAPQR